MKNPALILFLLLCALQPVSSQIVQRGIVVELSSGNTPIENVEVRAKGAAPTVSGTGGTFALAFAKAESGDPLLGIEIYKKGYQLVNEKEILSQNISSASPLKIVLCKAGTLEESRRKYYRIGEDRYYGQYLELVDELKKEQLRGRLDKMEYDIQLETYKKEFHDSMNKLYYYADKFARINKDELSEIDAQALLLLEEGRVDEAIQVYEESGLIDEFHQKSNQLRSIETEN